MLGGSAGKQGGNILGNLFGGTVVDGMSSTISKFTGINATIVKSVLGYLAPLVLGAVAKSFGGSKIDGPAIANLFASQKSNISAALPKGFSLDSIQGFASLGSASGSPSAPSPASAPTSGGGGKLALLAIALAALIGLYFYWDKAQKAAKDLKDKASEAASTVATEGEKMAADATAQAKDTAASAMKTVGDAAKTAEEAVEGAKEKAAETMKAAADSVGDAAKSVADKATEMKEKAAEAVTAGMDALKGDFTSMLDGLTGKLGKISDAAGAEEVLPDLEGYASKLDGMFKSASALPAEGKSMLVALVKSQIEKLNPIFDKLTNMPGIGDAFKSIIEQIKTKLTGFLE